MPERDVGDGTQQHPPAERPQQDVEDMNPTMTSSHCGWALVIAFRVAPRSTERIRRNSATIEIPIPITARPNPRRLTIRTVPVSRTAGRARSFAERRRPVRWRRYVATTRRVDSPYTTLRRNPTELASSK